MAESDILVRTLIEFGAQMELEVIPIHWTATGTIPDHTVMLKEMFKGLRPAFPPGHAQRRLLHKG